MEKLLAGIAYADPRQIDLILQAAVRRYGELFPDWEMVAFSLCKSEDKSKQIDSAIAFLQKMKDIDE